MQIFFYILPLYVLFLATVPCFSDDNCNDEMETGNPENHSQGHKERDCNTCSPFFTCETCSDFVFIRSGIDLKKAPFTVDKLIALCKSQFADDFFAKIWKPPKVSK